MSAWKLGVAAIFCLKSFSLAADQSCVFEKLEAQASIVPKEMIAFYGEEKQREEERYLTKDGVYIYVKNWSCNHFGKSVYITMTFDPQSDIKKNIIKYAKLFLKKEDVSLLSASLKNASDESLYEGVDIKGSSYSEFFARVYDMNKLISINISYYSS